MLRLLLLCLPGFAFAQSDTDIYLFDVTSTNGALKFSEATNITQRPGYDNQPHFSPDGKFIYFTSIREDGQADIYRYDMVKMSNKRLTNTNESEYSPTVMPDKKHFSVVRVEADSTQRLWKFPLEGGAPSVVNKKITAIGYHCWMSAKQLAFFVIGDKNTLQVAGVKDKEGIPIIDNVGRCIQKIPGEDAISFVTKVNDNDWLLQRMEMNTRDVSTITTTLPGCEDYTWGPNETLWMGKANKLYRFKVGEDKSWQEVTSFNHAEVTNITRIAMGPFGRKIAVVTDETE